MQGRIIKGIGGFYYVDIPGKGLYACRARGIFRKENKKPLVGDVVRIRILDEKDKEGRYIRRERYSGSMSRSFYVGSRITEPDIHAKYENGILTLNIPKEDEKAIEKKRFIEIEG